MYDQPGKTFIHSIIQNVDLVQKKTEGHGHNDLDHGDNQCAHNKKY